LDDFSADECSRYLAQVASHGWWKFDGGVISAFAT